MINDIDKFDFARRNLIVTTSVFFLLVISNTDIDKFKLFSISFDLEDSPYFINSYLEIIFYISTYLFVKYLTYLLYNEEFFQYMKTSTFFKANEIKNDLIKILEENNTSIEDINKMKKGMTLGLKIRALLLIPIFDELFLNKNFILFILPVIFYFTTIIMFLLNAEINFIIITFTIVNIAALFYLLFVPLSSSFIIKLFELKSSKRKIDYSEKLKEKYKRIKENKVRNKKK